MSKSNIFTLPVPESFPIPLVSYRSRPLIAFFGVLKEGAVENQDPSGFCGGLFYLAFLCVLRFLTSITVIMVIFEKYIVLLAKFQKGKEEIKLFVQIDLRKNLIIKIFDDYKR